jgi:hypothetical protein
MDLKVRPSETIAVFDNNKYDAIPKTVACCTNCSAMTDETPKRGDEWMSNILRSCE